MQKKEMHIQVLLWQIMVVLLLCFGAVPSSAQHFGSAGDDVRYGVTAPTMQMQSTSVMSGGSANTRFGSTRPSLTDDGYAVVPYTPQGPLYAKGNGGNAGTPEEEVKPGDRLPIGDAVLPMLLLLAGYAILRRKREHVG